MNPSYYKYCAVPQCKTTTIKTPNKLFIYVSNNKQIRKKWFEIGRGQDAPTISSDSTLYFCENHFDLPNDMINYMEYHIMGSLSSAHETRLCMPKKFECQEDRKKRTCSDIEGPYMLKKQRMSTITECLNEPEQSTSSTPSSSIKDTSTSSDFQKVGEAVPEALCLLTTDKSVQALVTHNFRSKAVQTKIKSTDKAVSPLKPSQISVSTSPFKSMKIINSRPSVSSLSKITIYLSKHIFIQINENYKFRTCVRPQQNYNIFIEAEQSDSDVSLFVPSASTTSSSPVQSLQVKSSSDCSEFIEEDKS